MLSNSDRYADDSVEARDLIDLAVLRLRSPIPQVSIEKAEKAYQVMRPLKRAIAPCPIPHAQCPMPHAPYPMP
ncbi:MAG: hypothetical protein RM368_06580 [Nostoc sp. DedSLP03]|nr:hypothetical protein [Nostoc sp. DedSLP03]